MVIAQSSVRRVIDLRHESSARARFDRTARWTEGGVGAIAVAGAGLDLLVDVSSGTADPDLTASLIFVAAAGAFLLWAATLWMKPGPTTLLLSPEGVEVASRKGRRTLITWTQPRLHIVLEDSRAYINSLGPRYATARSGLVWMAPGRRNFDLSLEAYESILDVAQAMGARIGSRVETQARFSPGVTRTDITNY